MDNETIDTSITGEAVAFIDGWLDEHHWFIDTRTIDFALDLRRMLTEAAVDQDDEEPVLEPA